MLMSAVLFLLSWMSECLKSGFGMENYSKIESKPVVEEPKEAWDIIVGSGSKVKAVISKGMKLLEETGKDKIVLTGFGPTVNKTITCAEIIKRRKQNLYQNNKLFYKRMEETWEPKQEGLDRLTVTRNIPAIKIVLSKIPLNVNEPGYQPPLNVTGKRKTSNVRRHEPSHERRVEDNFSSKQSIQSSGRSASNAQNREKIPKTKRFKTLQDK